MTSVRHNNTPNWPEAHEPLTSVRATIPFESLTTDETTLPLKPAFSSSTVMVSPRRLYSTRPPPILPRNVPKGPPSIPTPDLAWGYEEDTNGILTLQQPATKHKPNSSRGPGAYSPSCDLILPSAPRFDFGRSTGRYRDTSFSGLARESSAAQKSTIDPDPAEGQSGAAAEPNDATENEGLDSATTTGSSVNPSTATEPPVPWSSRRPMPIAANLLRSPRPPHSHNPIAPQPPSPGPGEFDPIYRGDARYIRVVMPKQTRHYNRPLAALPRPPGSRVRAMAPRHVPEAATRAALLSRAAVIGPPVSKPPFLKHAEQSKTMSEEEFERLQSKARRKKEEEQERHRRSMRRFGSSFNDSWETTEDEPEGLTKREKLLWKSFVSADVNGDRRLSKREMMDGLERKALDSDRVQAILRDYKDHDDNANGFVEWAEFLALAQSHPELEDIMRDDDMW